MSLSLPLYYQNNPGKAGPAKDSRCVRTSDNKFGGKMKNINCNISKRWTPTKHQEDDSLMIIDIRDRYGARIIEVKILCEEWYNTQSYRVYVGQDLWADFTVDKNRDYEYREVI